MPARIQLEHQRDFTGGLNIADDPYNLAPNESFDLKNVDINRRGGFSIRRGTKRFITTSTTLTNPVDTLYTYVDPSGVRHLLACGNGQIKRWDGAAWVQIQPVVGAGTCRFAEMNGTLFILHPAAATAMEWSGSGVTTAITAVGYNDNFAAPANNRFPRAKVAAVHNGVMIVGNLIVDSLDAAAHPSRIRWSHPGKPKDWRTNDWIDIDPEDGCGAITALVPMQDRLVVFKERAIYTVHGYPPEGFSVTNITRKEGTPSPHSVYATEGEIYFWDSARGAYVVNERELRWLFRPLFPYLDDSAIDLPNTVNVRCAYHNDRVWFSVPWVADPYANTRVGLLYAPSVGKEGAWTLHDKSFDALHVHYESSGGNCHLLGGSGAYVMELDVENYFLDETPGTGATSKINAAYTTRWFDGNNPALKKRWKRPIVVVGLTATQEFLVDVFNDYDPTHIKRTFSLFTDVTGTDGVWDVSNWDGAYWAGELGEAAVLLRGSPLSGGTARALRFSNVTSGVDWVVYGLTMKWVPKRIRN